MSGARVRAAGGGVLAVVVSLLLAAPAQAAPATKGAKPRAPGVAAAQPAAVSAAAQAKRIYYAAMAQYVLDHDDRAAEAGLAHALEADPGYAPALFNLGVLAESRGDWAKARDDFQRYLARAPDGPDAERARRESDLLAAYEAGVVTAAAEKAAPYDAAVRHARAFLSAGLYREAVAEAGQAQAMNPYRWEAYAVVALCMARQGRSADAAKFEDMALARTPAEKRKALQQALEGGAGKPPPKALAG